MALMGLDIGTSGCKCTIFTESGEKCSYAYNEYQTINKKEGHFELDPEEVWTAVKSVISEAVQKNNKEKVTALCVSSFGEAGIPLDEKGRILHNSILYTDKRGSEQCNFLINQLGLEKIMKLTGLRAHPMYTISKVMWIKENMPELYSKIWKVMLFEDFILYRLGGVVSIDYSLASRTMAFNIKEKNWENIILNEAGIKNDIFSEPVPSGTVVGTIKPNLAEKLGLSRKVKLVTGGHDQVCAATGGGIFQEGVAIDSTGTVECITPAFNKPLLNEKMLNYNFACVPHARQDMYVTYAFNFTGGSLLKWYRDNFAKIYKKRAEKKGKNVYQILDEQAAENPTDLLVLPHFAGAGTPFMDMSARGAVLGLSFDTDDSKFYRGLLEGVTYEMLYNIECLEKAGIEIKSLKAVGGGARSELWLQIKADIMGRKISALDVEEAGTLGTVILAGTATGIYKSIDKAAKSLISIKKEYYPDKENHEKYMEQYQKYKKMYEMVKEVMER